MAFINDFFVSAQNIGWYYMTAGYLPIIIALLLGIIPALIWLLFWLHEDNKNPEPRGMIMAAFFAGLLAVFLTIPLQRMFGVIVPESSMLIRFFAWASIEEILKFGTCYFIALRAKANNEPIDAIIYLITTALGFAAFENALFIIHPLIEGEIIQSFVTSNFRFIGASLLHVIASATIGVALALTYYKSTKTKVVSGIIGIAFAILLHTLFNLLIIIGNGTKTFLTFSLVWIGVAILIGLFEKIKKIKK